MMKQEEVIKITDILLKSVPDIREHIRLIDTDLKNNTYDKYTDKKLHQEQHRLKNKLTRIIKAVSTLDDESQRIICYRYFDKLNYKETAIRVHLSERTIHRRIDKSKLNIGRIMVGFEDEFWDCIYFDKL